MDLARQAPDLGIAGLFVFDHLVPIGDARRPVLESAAMLGALAATTLGRVGSLVTRVTLRSPAITAAIAATIAAIAPGRVLMGLGIGDRLSADEADRYGMELGDLKARLSILGATIDAIRIAAPSVPIWVGGRHPEVRAVAADRADGWNAWGVSADELSSEAQEIRERAAGAMVVSWGGAVLVASDQMSLDRAVAARGGSQGVISGTPGEVVERLGALGAVADELVVSLVPNRSDNREFFGRQVLATLAGSARVVR
jgi:alkanesulfonate monooxygenase SsuD/methylene tetrahydromethanopterin reductase-like flavin-dependent oxidoreductase (luciferase family)